MPKPVLECDHDCKKCPYSFDLDTVWYCTIWECLYEK